VHNMVHKQAINNDFFIMLGFRVIGDYYVGAKLIKFS
jgi:hypothetical protein